MNTYSLVLLRKNINFAHWTRISSTISFFLLVHTPTLFCLQVDVPSLSGDFGIIAQHVPTLAALKPGVVTVHEDDASHKYFVSSGTVTVNSDSSVQILAEEAAPLDRYGIIM